MVKCLNCQHEFPYSDLLEKAYSKEPETCSKCQKQRFAYFNVRTTDNEETEINNHNNYLNDEELYILEEEKLRREAEIEEEIYQQQIRDSYDFEDEYNQFHHKATYDYIMNDYNNNGIPDHKE